MSKLSAGEYPHSFSRRPSSHAVGPDGSLQCRAAPYGVETKAVAAERGYGRVSGSPMTRSVHPTKWEAA
jgi:hypothetical protein